MAVAVAVTVAVGLAIEPVGFDGFFRSYGQYGRIMRMGMARIARMGALCVRKGVLGDREKYPKKGGARHREISPKIMVSTKKRRSKKVSKFLLFLVDIN